MVYVMTMTMYVMGNLLGFMNLLVFFLQFDASFSNAKMICLIRDIIGAEVPHLLYFFSLLSIYISSRLNHPQINPESHLNIVVVVSNFICQFNTIC
jgi:hypothetical protein